jgi:predicted PurR-regulated permease PerM
MPTPDARYQRWRTLAVTVWAVIGILVLVAAALWGLTRISGALVPFIVAFMLVFLLSWPVRELTRRGLSRGVAALICILGTLLALGGFLTLVGPFVGRQLVSLGNSAPVYLAKMEALATALGDKYANIAFPRWLAGFLSAATSRLSQLAVTLGNDAAITLVSTGSGLATALFDFLIAMVIAFWALKDLPKLRDEFIVVAGPTYEADVEHLITTVTRVVGGYLKGQTIAALTIGTAVAIGLSVIGVPYALVLGIVTGLFSFAPYVGPFAAALIAGLVGLFHGGWIALAAIAVVAVAQNLTDTLVTPRVMSEQVDLHPTLVIFSLLVGGSIFGIPGMLFAIPVAATGKGLFVYYYEKRTDRSLTTSNGAMFRDQAPDADHSAECRLADPDPGPDVTEPRASKEQVT